MHQLGLMVYRVLFVLAALFLFYTDTAIVSDFRVSGEQLEKIETPVSNFKCSYRSIFKECQLF